METQPQPSQGETLLIIDDEPMITDLFRQAMTNRSFNVKVAHSGQEALDLIAATPDAPLNMVITDMTMPGMDGMTVARELYARLPQVSVLIATGHELDTEELGLTPNVVEIIRKPFRMSVLAERIRQILANQEQAGE